MKLLIIARLTLHEAARRRLLLAVLLLTIGTVAFTSWGFSHLDTGTGRDGRPIPHSTLVIDEATLVILIAFMFSVVLAVGAAFLAAPAIAGDVESGALLAILPRPLRRAELVAGRWLGLATLLLGYAILAGGLELASVALVTGYAPPHPVQAVGYLVGQAVVVMTLALLGSTRLSPMTCGIVAIILFGASWIAGIARVVGEALANDAVSAAATVFSLVLPTDFLWRGAVYNLEPAVMLALSHGVAREAPFSVADPPPPASLLWALAWTAGMLGLAVFSFGRRDL